MRSHFGIGIVIFVGAILLFGAPESSATDRAAERNDATLGPPDLQVNGPVLLHVKAQGVQIYSCIESAAGELTWSAAVPEAEFVAEDGTRGRHFKGPTWQLDSGARIVGRKLREHPSPEPGAIPWLLLAVKAHSGDGPFTTAVFIQRVNTTGGMPTMSKPQTAGDRVRVPYTAEYIFYGPGATTRP